MKNEKGNELSVLVVDDVETCRCVATAMLQRLGHSVDAVSDGKRAIEMLREKHYDLVFMDCRMPEMNGLMATSIIRECTSGVMNHNVPIVALTAGVLKEEKEACMEVGMNGFVAKPVFMQDLVEIIQQIRQV